MKSIRAISGFIANSTENSNFSVKKTFASFQKDAGDAKELQFVVCEMINDCIINFISNRLRKESECFQKNRSKPFSK